MFSSFWSIAILCLQLQKSSPAHRSTLFTTPEPQLCFTGEFGESLPCLSSTSLPAPEIWNWGPWEAWTALWGGNWSSPRRVSSVWRSGWSCCTQIPPAVTIRPSCPAHSYKRLGGTAPWFDSAADFDRRSAGGKRLRVGDWWWGGSKLCPNMDW